MKSLHDSLIVALDGEEKLEASIPAGCHAISGPGGYIVMPDELSVEEWEARQNNSKTDKGVKSPHRRNVANKDAKIDGKVATDITESAPTEASIRADEAAFDELFPDLETD